jgi:hypothetical protein
LLRLLMTKLSRCFSSILLSASIGSILFPSRHFHSNPM